MRELSIVAAPVLVAGRTIGALGVEYAFDHGRDLHRALSYVTLLASVVAQAVAGARRASERQRLSDETSELRNRVLEQAEFPRLVGTSAPLGEVQTFGAAQVADDVERVLEHMESDDAAGVLLRFEDGLRGACTS